MVEITSSFECGNGQNIRRLSEGMYALDVKADPGYCYYFCVRLINHGSASRVRLNVYPDPEHAKKGLSSWPIDKASVVWVRRGDNWHALPDLSFADSDTMQVGDDGYRISLLVGAGETVDVSNQIIIPYSEMGRWLARTAEESCGLANLNSIGKSALGRDIHCLTVTEPDGAVEKREGILILSGEHATEFAGEWAVRGIVEYLLSNMPLARTVRRHFSVAIIPQANPDGNALGRPQMSGNDLNLYSSYLDATAGVDPGAPEGRAIWELAREQVPCLFLDMHGYVGPRNHGDPPYHGAYVPPLSCYQTEFRRTRQERVMEHLRFETDAMSQHLHFLECGPDTLAYQLASSYGTAVCLYEPNMADGRYGNMKTGIRVLKALAEAIKT